MTGKAYFRGRVGVIIEIAPNQFAQYVINDSEASIVIERDSIQHDWSGPLGPVMFGPTYVTMNLTGVLASNERTEPPVWAERTAEIEARPAIEGQPTKTMLGDDR